MPLRQRHLLTLAGIGLPVLVFLTLIAIFSPTDCTRPSDHIVTQHLTLLQMQRTSKALDALEEAGRLPRTDPGLASVLDELPDGKFPVDGWGQPLLYFSPPVHDAGEAAYELVSFGRDGQPGGEGEDADLLSSMLSGTTL